MKTKDEILEEIIKFGYCINRNNNSNFIQLEEIGVIIRVSKLTHKHPHILNPDYTYVSNNEFGKALAICYPLGGIID